MSSGQLEVLVAELLDAYQGSFLLLRHRGVHPPLAATAERPVADAAHRLSGLLHLVGRLRRIAEAPTAAATAHRRRPYNPRGIGAKR